jgi:RNA polymerase sigma-70 factor (TIGR02960 family)
MEVVVMSADLLSRAQSGDREAFTELVEPLRSDIQVLCYRMLGSLQDAEDTLQEVLLAAWVGLAGFEGRSSFRTWLHRIATNRCLNVLRASARQPVPAKPLPVTPPDPSRMSELTWLQPYPDLLLEGLPERNPGPEARYESREAISLAFITAIQLLPPNQRAVVLLRDVLGYRAAEAAELLGLTDGAVNSALKRARATLQETYSPRRPERIPATQEERELTERLVEAFTGDDVEAMIELMSEDVWIRMPPLPFEYRGRDACRRFLLAIMDHRKLISHMVPTRANGQPAWGEYIRDAHSGVQHCIGLMVVEYWDGSVSELVHFESGLAPYFGLPRTLA